MKKLPFLLITLILANGIMAQPAYSRGEQLLTINYETAIQRARAALVAEGYVNLTEGGAFVSGFKENNTAIIMCNVAPDAKTWINIVVASNTNDAGTPGAERLKLQKRMDQNFVSGNLVGTWILRCCNDELQWTMTIAEQKGIDFSGSLNNDGGGGTIAGTINGSNIEFTRSGSWGKQKWTGQLVSEGGKLKMVNGSWTGDYQDRYTGRNNWHAEKN